jgi:hypothetical protein
LNSHGHQTFARSPQAKTIETSLDIVEGMPFDRKAGEVAGGASWLHVPGLLSPAVCQATRPHHSCVWKALDTSESVRGRFSSHGPGVLSGVQVGVDCHHGQESRRQQLLAMHGLWRGVERLTVTPRWQRSAPVALTHTQAIGELVELIAALERRVPQIHRSGEIAIARDAAALKERALQRIAELEQTATFVDSD